MATAEYDFTDLETELEILIGLEPNPDPQRVDRGAPMHVQWPTHPDGSNKTIGEMTVAERRAQTAAACRRMAAQFIEPETEDSIRSSYAPYDKMPEFEDGFRAWGTPEFIRLSFRHSGVAAQAFDRGAEAAMRVQRLQRGA
jgi:hypothetical protein